MTHEYDSSEATTVAAMSWLSTIQRVAGERGMPTVLVVYDWPQILRCANHIIALFPDVLSPRRTLPAMGLALQNLPITDVAQVWRAVEGRDGGETTPLNVAVAWATSQFNTRTSLNACDAAYSTSLLLNTVVGYGSLQLARWHIFAANTTAQVPSHDKILNCQRAPRLEIL